MATIQEMISRPEVDLEKWTDWHWQQKHAIRSVDELRQALPTLPQDAWRAIELNHATRRMQVTPYSLHLIQRSEDGLSSMPLSDNHILRQLVPYWRDEGSSAYAYDQKTENWEMPEEMVTPIAQHKYDNRVIIRLSNTCHCYCQFCYEALRTVERTVTKPAFQRTHWRQTVEYVKNSEQVEEVILSGGEPLMQGDRILDEVLDDLRRLPRRIEIRLHTRALTFNPFRITDALVALLRRYDVRAIGLHVTHVIELTPDFERAVARLRGACPIVFANIPLLAGINDNLSSLRQLCMRLYGLGVIPHYLYHFMPHSPGTCEFRTSVQRGIDLIRQLKRRVSNLAVPEYVLPHATGKHTMPILGPTEDPPRFTTDRQGRRVVRYRNWAGMEVDYLDQ